MATFLLRSHDGEKDIVIPSGKTTIGRGSFLGVSDKRVSRTHAVLELTDGNLSVLPLHTNPTFYKANVKEKFVSLKKNEAQNLVGGNIISLLPDALCFEIVCEGNLSKNGKLTTEEVKTSKDRTMHNIPPLVVDYAKPSTASKVPTESFLDEFIDNRQSLKTGPTAANQDTNECHNWPSTQTQHTVSVKEHTTSPSKPQVKPAPLLQKTRKLPSWLIQSTSSETKSPANKEENKKGKAWSARSTGNKTTMPNKGGRTMQKTALLAQKKQERSVPDEDFIASDNDEEDRPLKHKGKGQTISKKRMSADMDESDGDITPAMHKKTKQTSESDDEDVPLRPAKNRTKPVLRDDDITPVLHKKTKQTSESDDEDVPLRPAKNRTKPVLGDDDITPAMHKKTKQTLSESDDEDVPLRLAKNRTKPVLGDELSSGSEDDVKSGALKKREETKTPDEGTSAPKLPICPYGSKCYRKNPIHFKEYLHPGKDSKADDGTDDKAAGVSDEDDDDRPECPYGTSCYRSNIQHKQDFKHTTAPGRSKKKNSKHKSVLDNESDDDGPNTYDYNDSFFDDGDDAEDSGSSYSAESDDSDWQPQGGDDDDDDVNELLTEARGFLRSKKMAKPV